MIGGVNCAASKRRGAGGGGTDPSTVATLTLLLIENTGITGDPASAWANQGGASANYTEGTAGLQPDVLASPVGALQFDGDDDRLIAASGTLETLIDADGYTAYYLFTLDSVPIGGIGAKYNAPGIHCDATNGAWGLHAYGSGGTGYLLAEHNDSGGTKNPAAIALSTSTLYLARFRYDGTDIYLRANGSENSVTAGSVTPTTSASVRLGESYGNINAPITLRYIAVYDSHLGTTDRDGIDTWFQAQYPTVTL